MSQTFDPVEPFAQNPKIPPAFCAGGDDGRMAYRFLPAKRYQLHLMPPSLRDWQAERPPGVVLLRRARPVGLLRALQGTQRKSHHAVVGLGRRRWHNAGGRGARNRKFEHEGLAPVWPRWAGAAQAARSYSWTMPARTSLRLTLLPVFEITGWGTSWASPRPRCGRASLCRRKVGRGGNTSRRSPSVGTTHPRDQRVHPRPAPWGGDVNASKRCSYFPFRPIAAGPKGP